MASSYEHLVAAEELLQTAHGLLQSGKRRRAAPLIRLASGFLEAATIRDRITAEPPLLSRTPEPVLEPVPGSVPAPSARPSLPPWCGQCDGPEVSLRWISEEDTEGRCRATKCPRCHPGSSALTVTSAKATTSPGQTTPLTRL
ncbi:hypothetical protein Shyd_93900 [Streptomyces hydrogenans]|uniref:Uncharacterized protein n=1 Tax=Streptomyces hydrogenans TaxID=1873719 RepID=A0ABQ3PKR4_9ACTN|nr:hypothetical protein GCM10018784_36400 [Streptomyces hydrogenans]GHI22822.1 hypothetical protein Shyd_41930 [Streptomyces hydrogenans]GHI24192.1 hypothetical protein Shyd_55630 [Streptomyces hydrogenans]GHI24245.1 hypothetical protein Shyd_56160 [Streptomyces hydrogenans]GHI24470.1 hypothetical protein Shyd_58410 [Streptomyces hydrogenans]